MTTRLLARLIGFCDRQTGRWRATVCRLSGAAIGAGTTVGPQSEVALAGPPQRFGLISIGRQSRLERGVVIHPYGGKVQIGDDVFVGPHAVIYGHGGVEIGDHALISMHCRILSSNHAIAAVGEVIRSKPDVRLPTKIGRDVWLGAGVTVLGGVSISEGCVVGAGAVVTHDLEPYSIAVGVPARVVGKRPGPGQAT